MNPTDMLTIIYRYKKLYERRCCELMKQLDLRIADLDILFFVSHSGPKNFAKDIVDMGMSKSNVSKSVEHLRKNGYVVLSEDQEDRRCVHIEITKKAAPVVRELEIIREEMGRNLLKGVSEADKSIIIRIMYQIGENMNTELNNMP